MEMTRRRDTATAVSNENEQIVRGLYETWNRTGGVPAWDSIDPEIEVEFTGGLLKGKYRGHDGLSEVLDSFWGYFDESSIEVESCLQRGDEVFVTLRYFARGLASGVNVDAHGCHVWTLREGKAVRWLIFGTRDEALRALGVSA